MQKLRGKIMGRIFVALMAIWLGLQGTVRAASNVLTVSGVVRDSRNSNGVRGALIIVIFEGRLLTTFPFYSQKNGDYSISFHVGNDEAMENCKIIVSKEGFSPTQAIINISFDTKKDFELFIIPEKCSNDKIESKVVQLADSIIDTDGAMTGLALLRAYKLTRKMEKDGTFVTDGHKDYLDKVDIIAQNVIENIDKVLGSTDLTFLYYLSVSDFFKSPAEREEIFVKGVNAITEKIIDRGQFLYGALDAGDWVEVFRLYGDKLSKETQEDLNEIGERFIWYADACVDHLMERYTTTKDGRYGVFFMKGYDGYYDDYIDIALHAKVTEVLKRFYNNSTYQEKIKASVAFLNTIQKNGYFYGKGIPLINFDNYFGNSDYISDNIFEMVSIHDQACAIMAQAVNCQTTWTNYDKKIGTYWGANALVAMIGSIGSDECRNRSQDAADIISALYYSCREGDVDRSGKIIAYDALQVLRASVGRELPNGPALLAADFDGDDKINSFDAQCILKLSVGKEPPVPVSP